MSGMYLYCQNTDCGAYLGSLGGDACQHCGWTNPEPQADALDAERWSEIGKSIERACGELPEDFEITIHLENGAGTVVLLYPNGEECENFPHDDGFAGVVNAATDAAIAKAEGGGV